jgi:hypothetical protein
LLLGTFITMTRIADCGTSTAKPFWPSNSAQSIVPTPLGMFGPMIKGQMIQMMKGLHTQNAGFLAEQGEGEDTARGPAR